MKRDTIVRRVVVDRRRSPQEVLNATRRKQYNNPQVVAAMPGRGDTLEKLEVYLFRLSAGISSVDARELEEEYMRRGLVPADPYAQAAVNEKEAALADSRPNLTYWKDAKGVPCFISFHRWDDRRGVLVGSGATGYRRGFWFGGVKAA